MVVGEENGLRGRWDGRLRREAIYLGQKTLRS